MEDFVHVIWKADGSFRDQPKLLDYHYEASKGLSTPQGPSLKNVWIGFSLASL